MEKQISFFIVLLCFLFFSQCKQKIEHNAEAYYANIDINDESEMLIENIQFDSIVVENISSSFVGYIRVFADTIYFVDHQLSRIFPIDIFGNVNNFRLGSGRGPNEYPGGIIYDYVNINENKHFIIGVSHDFYKYDKNWEIINQQPVDWQIRYKEEELLYGYEPDMHELYGFVYHTGRDRGRVLGDYVYYEVNSYHPEFNMFASRDYYRKGRVIAKLNHNTGMLKRVLGIRSLAYEDYEYIGHFSFCSYDVNSQNKEFFLGFQSDSLIYVCNDDFVPIRAFGIAGRDMNTTYTEYSGRDLYSDDLKNVWMNDIENCGYYDGIEYIAERDVLFRSYTRGKHAEYDGLQIYHKEKLVADIDVPKYLRINGPSNFKVKGYIEPYFISNIHLDFENNRGVIYKFKLDL